MGSSGRPRLVFICHPKGILGILKEARSDAALKSIGACNPPEPKAAQPTSKQYLIHRVFPHTLENQQTTENSGVKARYSRIIIVVVGCDGSQTTPSYQLIAEIHHYDASCRIR